MLRMYVNKSCFPTKSVSRIWKTELHLYYPSLSPVELGLHTKCDQPQGGKDAVCSTNPSCSVLAI